VSYPERAKNKTDWFQLFPAGLVLEKTNQKKIKGINE
jgi:hypothetical protein